MKHSRAWMLLVWLMPACQGTDAVPGTSSEPRVAEPAPAAFSRFDLATLSQSTAHRAELIQRGDWLEARKVARTSLEAQLPQLASGAVRLRSSGFDVAVSLRLSGTKPVAGRTHGERLLFEAAGPAGSDLLIASHDDHIEDYVRFESPGTNRLSYELDVTQVAGLRLIANSLELLDASGMPRLRVSPPYVVDASGRTAAARLSVEGCAYDSNPALPQLRPVLGPSASQCTLGVTWDDAGLSYPVIVDPRWSSTKNALSSARVHQTGTHIRPEEAADLKERFCLIGGHDGHGNPVDAIECFVDEAWMGVGTLGNERGRFDHTATLLLSKRILIIGGSDANGPLKTSQVYNPLDGKVDEGPELSVVRRTLHTATRVDSGDVVVLGGGSLLPLIFSEDVNGQLTVHAATGKPMAQSRFGHVAELAAGKVFVFGGSATPDLAEPLDTVGYFDPTANKEEFSEVDATMNAPRIGHTATRLPPIESALHGMGERVLVVGGSLDAELFDPQRLVFETAASRAGRRRSHHAAVPFSAKNGDQMVLLVGGADDAFVWDSNDVYSGRSGQWTEPELLLSEQRERHSATVMSDGHTVVVAGGQESSVVYSQSAESAVLHGPGEACEASSDCVSGVCSKKVCCATRCDGACEACAVAAGAERDGICSTLEAGTACGDATSACRAASSCDGNSSACPEPAMLDDDSPCTNGGESGLCRAGACIEPFSPGAGGGGVGGDDAGGAPQAGQAGGGGHEPDPEPPKPPLEPGIHCDCTVVPRDSHGAWLFAGLLLAGLVQRRRGGGKHASR